MTKVHQKWMARAGGLCLLVLIAALAAGCGGKKELETDPTTMPAPVATETVPTTPVPEPRQTPEVVPPTDFSVMDPSEYGIQDVFFAFDVYTLSDVAMGVLADNAVVMREKRGLTWLVEGHCDERGTVEYNLALGEKRAMAVRDYLVSLGVPRGSLRVTSYGEERPFATGHNESSWQLNRRAHFARP